ncbi:MAG: hypothetical protein ACK5HP_02960 [Bacilli bacterium]
MKKNIKGFMLIETLAVSTFVIGTLVYLFIQFNNVKRSYDISYRYNTIPGIHGAKMISNYLNDVTYENLKTLLSETSLGYIDLTTCVTILGNSEYCQELVKAIDATTIIFTKETLDNVANSLELSTSYSQELYLFTKRFESYGYNDMYRIVIEYNNNTFASIIVG